MPYKDKRTRNAKQARGNLTPEKREKARLYSNAWAKKKYASDPVFREARKAERRTEKYREAARLRGAKKRRDPILRAAQNEMSRKSNAAGRRDPARWPIMALCGLRRRSKEIGKPCNLTVEDLCLPEVCPVFGVPFVLGIAMHPHGPTVDRLRPERGYNKGNIRIVSRRANQIKTDASAAEVALVCAWMQREGL